MPTQRRPTFEALQLSSSPGVVYYIGTTGGMCKLALLMVCVIEVSTPMFTTYSVAVVCWHCRAA